jgi:hypothetical protein
MGYMGLKAGLVVLAKRKFPSHVAIQTSVIQPVAQSPVSRLMLTGCYLFKVYDNDKIIVFIYLQQLGLTE